MFRTEVGQVYPNRSLNFNGYLITEEIGALPCSFFRNNIRKLTLTRKLTLEPREIILKELIKAYDIVFYYIFFIKFVHEQHHFENIDRLKILLL